MIPPQRALLFLRRAILALTGLLIAYALLRFTVVRLPPGALSPLHGIHPGDRLLVDRRAHPARPGEIVLYRGSAGELLLGRRASPPAGLEPAARSALAAGALWILSDRTGGPAPDSLELGPIPERDLVGRVVLVLPW